MLGGFIICGFFAILAVTNTQKIAKSLTNIMLTLLSPDEKVVTPPSNTVSQLQTTEGFTFNLDYLRLIAGGLQVSQTVDLLKGIAEVYFCTELVYSDRSVFCGLKNYPHSYCSPCNGFSFSWSGRLALPYSPAGFSFPVVVSPDFGQELTGYRFDYGLLSSEAAGSVEPGDFLLTISGKLLSALHFPELVSLCRLLGGEGFRCTRLDLALDDYNHRIDFTTLYESVSAGSYKYYRKHNFHQSSDGGWTIYLGSRTSSQYARIYNKFVQSGGVIDSTRYELELKDSRARKIFELLVVTDTDEEFYDLGLSVCLGGFSFVDKASSSNASRCEVLDWWQSFLAAVGASPRRFRLDRLPPTVERSIDWIRRSVAKTVATVCSAVGKIEGEKWFVKLIRSNYNLLTARQTAIVDTYRARAESRRSIVMLS